MRERLFVFISHVTYVNKHRDTAVYMHYMDQCWDSVLNLRHRC